MSLIPNRPESVVPLPGGLMEMFFGSPGGQTAFMVFLDVAEKELLG
ncbi:MULTISPECIES: hypothetical protein [Streptomyces]|nr:MULTISPECIES: hypothetical protein [Streptomyces]